MPDTYFGRTVAVGGVRLSVFTWRASAGLSCLAAAFPELIRRRWPETTVPLRKTLSTQKRVMHVHRTTSVPMPLRLPKLVGVLFAMLATVLIADPGASGGSELPAAPRVRRTGNLGARPSAFGHIVASFSPRFHLLVQAA